MKEDLNNLKFEYLLEQQHLGAIVETKHGILFLN